MTIAETGRSFGSARTPVGVFIFPAPIRIQASILARGERSLLDRLCGALPDWVTPDSLTAIGFVGAVVTAAEQSAEAPHCCAIEREPD